MRTPIKEAYNPHASLKQVFADGWKKDDIGLVGIPRPCSDFPSTVNSAEENQVTEQAVNTLSPPRSTEKVKDADVPRLPQGSSRRDWDKAATDPTVGWEKSFRGLGGRDRYWVETAGVSDVRRLRSSISHSRSAEDAGEKHTVTCKGKGKARSNSC